jgi:hypothetical protein
MRLAATVAYWIPTNGKIRSLKRAAASFSVFDQGTPDLGNLHNYKEKNTINFVQFDE